MLVLMCLACMLCTPTPQGTDEGVSTSELLYYNAVTSLPVSATLEYNSWVVRLQLVLPHARPCPRCMSDCIGYKQGNKLILMQQALHLMPLAPLLAVMRCNPNRPAVQLLLAVVWGSGEWAVLSSTYTKVRVWGPARQTSLNCVVADCYL
jgi:hypothetical protein